MADDSQQCPNVRWCELFPRLQSDRTLQDCMRDYCHAEFERCVRYQASLQRIRPPSTLLPDGRHLDDAGGR